MGWRLGTDRSDIGEFINTISFVDNCVVIGFEHPTEQCVPIAFVKLKDFNADIQDLKELLKKKCFSTLEETSVPYAFVFVDELPINVGGKIDIQGIKEVSKINLMKSDNIINVLSLKK